ncbi:MAG: ABC transporter ATP-binding protein [Bifidobacteriaceae bacterium]|jgi:multidrug/hemolysin transport system ATP-binding protein|nr:ABC transporter ATP-binding protein [Bifidobacteriaceae bacterium]
MDIVKVDHLRKQFHKTLAVNDLSFAVPVGSFFAFLGQNGAGKTTTINMLLGLLEPTSGSFIYADDLSVQQFKSHIGVVFQNNVLDDMLSVRENLYLYGELYLNSSKLVEKRLTEIVDQLNLRPILKQKFKTLSGGEKRKAEIARALFNRPRLLFLDEPTTGLDPKTRAEVWQLLYRVKAETGMTIFLTTHYMQEVADADQVIIIHRGKIVAHGTPAELKAQYTHDTLSLTPQNYQLLEQQLQNAGSNYTKVADTYHVPVDNTEQAITILKLVHSNLRFFEATRGDMDDVFLNAVGEQIDLDLK